MADNNMGKVASGIPSKGPEAYAGGDYPSKEGISIKAPSGRKVAEGYDGGKTSAPALRGNKIVVSTPTY